MAYSQRTSQESTERSKRVTALWSMKAENDLEIEDDLSRGM